MIFTASGGRPPYSWSTTKGTIPHSGPNNETGTLSPPTNPGPSVAGVAYKFALRADADTGLGQLTACRIAAIFTSYGCDDVIIGGCGGQTDPTTFLLWGRNYGIYKSTDLFNLYRPSMSYREFT